MKEKKLRDFENPDFGNDNFASRYDSLVDVECFGDMTIIREEDKERGQREIYLFGRSSKINSVICGSNIF
ncbi:MAG: hypothetical protein V1889_02430 [archaeon]